MLRRLHLETAGESHGPGLTAILAGLPAGLRVDRALLARQMARRQHGYGRGRRMQIEHDQVEIRGGVRGDETLGSPLALWIENRDYGAWQRALSADPAELDPAFVDLRRLHSPRPGHADLAGGQKYRRTDLRDVLERASARETAARVAAGAFARMLLAECGIELRSGVRSLGALGADDPVPDWEALGRVDDGSPLRAVRRDLEAEMVALVDTARQRGDTLGGTATVIAHGVPVGLGTHVAWTGRLDARIAGAMLSIPAIKGCELGAAGVAARSFGSSAHDAIVRDAGSGRLRRATNRAGGLEGGMTNGEDVVVTIVMKPISTLRDGLPSVDLDTGEPAAAQYERSDVTALPAAAVIAEAMLALVLADALLDKFGGDSMAELHAHRAASAALPAPWPASPRS